MATLTLEISDSQTITENLERSGNNINLGLAEAIIISEAIDSVYLILRSADIAFVRSDIP